ncbi:MAG: 4-hydroxythreonine-4-phosphate dehydrogenase PdxA [Woeseia sp.]
MRHTSKSVPDRLTAASAAKPRPLAVSIGEPAGIGPDLCIALAGSPYVDRLVVVGDPRTLEARARRLGRSLQWSEYDTDRPSAKRQQGRLQVLPIPLPQPGVCGTPDPANAKALLAALECATDGCRRGLFAALVTGPLQKSVINDAGIAFRGHTEFLAQLLSAPRPVMLLVAGSLRVALASTHLALREVPDYLTQARLRGVLEVLHGDLQTKFKIEQPKILVCGLNPHAGEQGHLGREEIDVIAPVVQEMQDRGLDVRGPLPADTAFTPNAGAADAILAMFHDQGLPVLKYAGFGRAVNVTLGLPIVRTSVDHGTALDIAGTGKADSGSMLAAVELAATLSCA